MKIANADKLKKHFENVVDVKLFTVAEICTIIDTFSSEVPEGEWKLKMKGSLGINTYECSKCGHLITCTQGAISHYKGCYCGAHMIGGARP